MSATFYFLLRIVAVVSLTFGVDTVTVSDVKQAIAVVNSSVTFSCRIDTPNPILWQRVNPVRSVTIFNGVSRAGTTSPRFSVTVTSRADKRSDLTIDHVQLTDVGQYACVEPLSGIDKQVFQLTVLDSRPVCTTNLTVPEHRVVAYDYIEVTCSLNATGSSLPTIRCVSGLPVVNTDDVVRPPTVKHTTIALADPTLADSPKFTCSLSFIGSSSSNDLTWISPAIMIAKGELVHGMSTEHYQSGSSSAIHVAGSQDSVRFRYNSTEGTKQELPTVNYSLGQHALHMATGSKDSVSSTTFVVTTSVMMTLFGILITCVIVGIAIFHRRHVRARQNMMWLNQASRQARTLSTESEAHYSVICEFQKQADTINRNGTSPRKVSYAALEREAERRKGFRRVSTMYTSLCSNSDYANQSEINAAAGIAALKRVSSLPTIPSPT